MGKKFIALLSIFVMILGATNAFALEIELAPMEKDLGEGLVFWTTLPADEALGYPASGLYRNGELVYGVDADGKWWWAQLFFSDDAMTFLFVPTVGGAESAIRFYNRGVIVLEHNVLGLLEGGEAALRPPYEMYTYFRWDYHEQRYYNRADNILRVTTAESNTISFDLRTGLILSPENLPDPDPGQEISENLPDPDPGQEISENLQPQEVSEHLPAQEIPASISLANIALISAIGIICALVLFLLMKRIKHKNTK